MMTDNNGKGGPLLSPLEWIVDQSPPASYIAVHAYKAEGSALLTSAHLVEEGIGPIQKRIQSWDREGWEVTFRVTPLKIKPTNSNRGTATDTACIPMLWMDLDLYKTSLSREQAVENLKRHTHCPTWIIDSGSGLHVYWYLDTPTQDLQAVLKKLAWLKQEFYAYGAEHSGLSQILRCPDTTNRKRSTHTGVASIYTGTTKYRLDQFPDAEDRNVIAFADIDMTAEPLTEDFLDELRLRSNHLADSIKTERGALDRGAQMGAKGVDRSRNDLWCAVRLLELGYAPEQVTGVLTHPKWFTGQKFRDTGDFNYVRATVQYAMDSGAVQTIPVDWMDDGKLSIVKAAESLAEEHNAFFIADQEYVYAEASGTFVEAGYTSLGKIIAQRLGLLWSTARANEIKAHIKETRNFQADTLNPSAETYLNTRSGMLDLTNMQLKPHSPGFWSTSQINATYNPHAQSEELMTFIEGVLRKEDIDPFFEFLGYCFIPDCRYRTTMFLVGPPRTGKSALLELVRFFLGAHSCSSVDVMDLADDPFASADLFGKIANIRNDTEAGVIRKGAILKSLVSGDPIRAQRKYQHGFTFANTAKMMFSCNELPTSSDPAMHDRLLILLCDTIHTETASDTEANIWRRIAENPHNLSAMLNLALEGMKRLVARGYFARSESTRELSKEYRTLNDPIFAWVAEECVEEPNGVYPTALAYEAFKDWCHRTGRLPESKHMLTRRMRERGFPPKMSYTGGKEFQAYVGIRPTTINLTRSV